MSEDSQLSKGYYLNLNDDGTVTVSFRMPLKLNMNLFLCFLFDGVRINTFKRGKSVFLTEISCHPRQWRDYLKEWGMVFHWSMEKIEETQRKFDEALKKFREEDNDE